MNLKKVRTGGIPDSRLELKKGMPNNRNLVPIVKNQTHFYNLQYIGTLFIGTNRQKMDFVFDTGSTQLWVPMDGCIGCANGNKYVPTDEFEATGVTDYISYVKGYVSGEVFTDVVRFTEYGFPLRISMLGVTYGEDNQGMQADGILGLSPSENQNDELLVKKLYFTKTIDIHAFGVSYLNEGEDSKIIFGGYDKTIVPSLDNFTWFDLVDTFYWSINITGVFHHGENLNASETVGVLDTGTSLVYFNYNTFLPIWEDIQSKHEECGINSGGWYYCYCDGVQNFTDITIQISGVNVTFPGYSYVEYNPPDGNFAGV